MEKLVKDSGGAPGPAGGMSCVMTTSANTSSRAVLATKPACACVLTDENLCDQHSYT